jgi:uncharacterized membrane protein YbhN (UPF0104 family)
VTREAARPADPPADTPPQRLRRLLPALVSAVIIAAASVVLYRTLSGIDPAMIVASLKAVASADLLLAAGFAGLALASLASYEVAMLRAVCPALPWRRPAFTGLVAYPIGHAVGFGALSGGAVRYRFYGPAGLSTFDVGKVIVLSAMPYAAGLGLLCGIALSFDAQEAAPLLAISPRAAALIGIALLLSHLAYVLAVLRVRGPLKLRWFDLELPSPRLTAIQYALGLTDVLCGIAVLYVLLPDGATSGFLPFVAVYVVAILAGLLSSVPAGLGVFESVLLLMLRDVPPESLLAAVLAYRMIYELLPFLLALVLFLAWEARARLQRRRPGA